MTRIPLHSPHLLPSLYPTAALIRSMASSSSSSSSASGSLTVNYPKPVSPPYPQLSKDVELKRAISAESRSATFTVNPNDIVFEDTWLAVVNKPSGIYCETLLSSLSSRPGIESSNLHLANRLDRDTSGLILISKSSKASSKLVHAFTHHEIKKTYLALCVAPPPQWQTVRLVSGHGRSKFGAWRVYATSDVGRKLPGGSTVRDMTTSFQVLAINSQNAVQISDTSEVETVVVGEKGVEWVGDDDDEEVRYGEVVVRAYPESGRTHQIRLHCQYLGIPIRGDVKYGGVLEWEGVVCEGHALHAESLSFQHPITGEPVCFRAPVPSWLPNVVTF